MVARVRIISSSGYDGRLSTPILLRRPLEYVVRTPRQRQAYSWDGSTTTDPSHILVRHLAMPARRPLRRVTT